MNERYYAHTAYDSTHPRHLHPADETKFGAGIRKLRRDRLVTHPNAQCREFFSMHNQLAVLRQLKSNNREIQQAVKLNHHEYIYWRTFLNPMALLNTFTGVMGIFTICSWLGVFFITLLVVLFVKPTWPLSMSFLNFIILPSIFLSLYFVGKIIEKKNTIKDKNNVIFNRRKGLVEIPNRKGPPQIVRFDELDPCLGKSYNPSGSVDYHLILSHRYSASFVQDPAGGEAPWQICVKWEYLQQYMDISRPLPDIPGMEPYRSRDPVTAAYDKQHNRPEHYWINIDMEKADQMNDAAIKAASGYPWELTREQAIAKGWQPSGVGEGDWRQTK